MLYTMTYREDEMMIVRKRPRNASATNAQRSGRKETVPLQALTLAAAEAVDSPNGPVKYVIRLVDIPQYANRSAISTPTKVIHEHESELQENQQDYHLDIYLQMMSLADLHPPEEDLTAVFPSSSAAKPVLDIVFVWLFEKL